MAMPCDVPKRGRGALPTPIDDSTRCARRQLHRWIFSRSMSALGHPRPRPAKTRANARPLRPESGQTADRLGMSGLCRLCCKSPKLPGDKILAIRRTNRRPPIYAASVTLPSSPARSSSGNEVPHIFTRKSRLQPGEFLVTSAKRLLQQYRH